VKILTLTLNPAFDVHCAADKFEPYRENLFSVTSRDAGGKGVNISRALNEYGVPNLAIIVVGEENGDDFCKMLDKEGMNIRIVTLPGRIRENVTLHVKDQPETRISFKGFAASPSLVDAVINTVSELAEEDTILTVTGSLPSGITASDIIPSLKALKTKGVRIVIDSRSFTVADIDALHPWLIKPNEEEISLYYGGDVNTPETCTSAAAALRAISDNVIISLGGKGAALATENGEYFACAPTVEVLSTVGAGDSMIAGFIAAANLGLPTDRSLALAVAFGSAACTTSGTQAPPHALVEKLSSEIQCKKF
jgi:1-phosphofructokinase family hexose kinase